MWQLFKSLLQQARVAQSRSSAINPLQWTLLILLATTLVLVVEASTPPWLLVSVASASGTVLLVLIAAYIYFMLTNPDALRSEKYSLAKTAMEKKWLGDSLTGLSEVIDSFEDSMPGSSRDDLR